MKGELSLKKRIVMLLHIAVLTLGLTVLPVMASADLPRPVEVETYTYGPLDELRINKVYQLTATDDPSSIPTEDFERNGRRYYFLDMIADNTDGEVVTYTVVYSSVELTRDAEYVGASGQSEFQPFDVDFFRKVTDPDLLPLFVCVGCTVMAVVIEFCANKTKQGRFKSFYGKNR